MKKNKNNAFTLAEVLITLGIIGIVAALTMPVLTKTIRHKMTSVKLKRFVSTMTQAILFQEKENGYINSWDTDLSTSQFLDTYFLPYVKATKGARYQKDDSLYFDDGSIMTILGKGGCIDTNWDYNGKAEPNKYGYDTFRFLFCERSSSNDSGECSQGFCAYAWYTGDKDRASLLEKCRINGVYCSALLQKDQWEFLSDYPY